MRQLLVITVSILLFTAASASAQTPAWSSAPDLDFGADASPEAVAVGDFDSDGRQDLAIADYRCDCVPVRFGNGDGTFRGVGEFEVEEPEALAVADFSADGHEDLAVAGVLPQDRELAIGRGEAGGAFQPIWALDLPTEAYALAVGNFDGDGSTDVAAAAGKHVAVRFNPASTAPGSRDIELADNVYSLAGGDFDGNATEDIVAVVYGNAGKLAVLSGKGNGEYAGPINLPLPDYAYDLAVGDLDGDGREDVAVPIYDDDEIVVRLGGEDGRLHEGPPAVPVDDTPTAIAIADLDGDGNEDLLTANYHDDTVSVRLGTGGGRFRAAGDLKTGDDPIDVAAGDFNGDGRGDFAVANNDGTVNVRIGTGPAPRAGNLLVNGDFEQAKGSRLPDERVDTPGWTTSGGIMATRYSAWPHFGVPTWLDSARFAGGRNFLAGGDSLGLNGVTTASQTVSVAGTASLIDAGRRSATLSARIGGGLAYPDNMTATAEFLVASGKVLGVLRVGPVNPKDRHNVTTLLRRAGTAVVPAGTRRIRVTLTSRDNDRYSSAMADNVSLTLTPRTPPPPPPAARPAFGRDTKVTLALAARRAPVRVRVVNANAFGVTGTLAARRFQVPVGGRATVRLALRKAQRRRLERTGMLVLRLSAEVTDPAGNRRTVARRVTLRSRAGRTARTAPRRTS